MLYIVKKGHRYKSGNHWARDIDNATLYPSLISAVQALGNEPGEVLSATIVETDHVHIRMRSKAAGQETV